MRSGKVVYGGFYGNKMILKFRQYTGFRFVVIIWLTLSVFGRCCATSSGEEKARRSVLSMGDSEGVVANIPGQMLLRSCLYGFGITGLRTDFKKAMRDSMWKVKCSPVSHNGTTSCKWTYDFVNAAEEKIKFQCDDGYYISGLYSDYSTQHSDRLWRIECCHSSDIHLLSCYDTPWMNYQVNFKLDANDVLSGLRSSFNVSRQLL